MYTSGPPNAQKPVDWLAVAAYPHKNPPPRPATPITRQIAAAPHLRRLQRERTAFDRQLEQQRKDAQLRAAREKANNEYIPPAPEDTMAFLVTTVCALCALVAGVALVVGG